jgi:hypothetical protein
MTFRITLRSRLAGTALLVLAIAGGLAGPALAGMTRFVGMSSAPLAAAPDGQAFATLYVSAAVAVTATEAGSAHVAARLWMHGDPTELGPLYTAPAPKGVEVGRLDALPEGHAIIAKTSNGWTLLELDGYLPASVVVDSLDRIWWTAELNYETICNDCHTPHAPNEYSPMQWGTIMPRMAKFAKLLPVDEMFILKWLQNTSATSDSRR